MKERVSEKPIPLHPMTPNATCSLGEMKRLRAGMKAGAKAIEAAERADVLMNRRREDEEVDFISWIADGR